MQEEVDTDAKTRAQDAELNNSSKDDEKSAKKRPAQDESKEVNLNYFK